jgi:PGF-pre-PGF domain-containing protein
MKRPLTFLLLIIAIALLLKTEQIPIIGAITGEETVCGNDVCETGEDYTHCPEDCTVPVCGNNAVEEDEDCDGIDDSLCPELCRTDCKCPPARARDTTILPYRYTYSYAGVKPNEVLTINLGRPKVDFMGLSVVTSQKLLSTVFIIDSNVSAPTIKPNGTVHAYFKLQLENSSQEQHITYAEIFFRVPTTWTIEHNVREVQLERADIQTWQPVQTQKLYQDLDYVYFSASPTKLGMFATVAPPPPPKPQPVCGNGILEEGETSETCCADAGCPQDRSCISNQCKFVAICGNNICELTENATSCPADCAAAQFRGSSASALILLVVALAAIMFYLSRKLPSLMPKKPIAKKHATPERWF